MKHIKKFESFFKDEDLLRASEIIGMDIVMDNAYQVITKFIEDNIENDEYVKEIDELTTIKRKLKL